MCSRSTFWTANNKLGLTSSKTEFFSTSQQLRNFYCLNVCDSVQLGGFLVNHSVNHTRAVWGRCMTPPRHFSPYKTVQFHMRIICRNRSPLSNSVLIPLANTMFSSRLDYWVVDYFPITSLKEIFINYRWLNTVLSVPQQSHKFQHMMPIAAHSLLLNEPRIHLEICHTLHKMLHLKLTNRTLSVPCSTLTQLDTVLNQLTLRTFYADIALSRSLVQRFGICWPVRSVYLKIFIFQLEHTA